MKHFVTMFLCGIHSFQKRAGISSLQSHLQMAMAVRSALLIYRWMLKLHQRALNGLEEILQ